MEILKTLENKYGEVIKMKQKQEYCGAKISRAPGYLYYVGGDGRVMRTRMKHGKSRR
jgi:ribosomal protein L24E